MIQLPIKQLVRWSTFSLIAGQPFARRLVGHHRPALPVVVLPRSQSIVVTAHTAGRSTGPTVRAPRPNCLQPLEQPARAPQRVRFLRLQRAGHCVIVVQQLQPDAAASPLGAQFRRDRRLKPLPPAAPCSAPSRQASAAALRQRHAHRPLEVFLLLPAESAGRRPSLDCGTPVRA
jgi:hypothetical protein